ncbi:hypothetical protein ACC698_37090, partial [Rhizobium johnstonii]
GKKNVEQFIVNRFYNAFEVRNDHLLAICQHCGESLSPAATRYVAMNGFVRLGQRRLLVNERMLLFA